MSRKWRKSSRARNAARAAASPAPDPNSNRSLWRQRQAILVERAALIARRESMPRFDPEWEELGGRIHAYTQALHALSSAHTLNQLKREDGS